MRDRHDHARVAASGRIQIARRHVSCQPHVGGAQVGRNSREVKTIILNHVNVQYLSAPDDS